MAQTRGCDNGVREKCRDMRYGMHSDAGEEEVRGSREEALSLNIWVDAASFKIRNT